MSTFMKKMGSGIIERILWESRTLLFIKLDFVSVAVQNVDFQFYI